MSELSKGVVTIGGQEFELVSFTFGAHQSLDDLGRPSSRVKAGQAVIQMVYRPTDVVTAFMFNPTKQEDVTVTIYKQDDSGKEKETKFKRAYCVGQSTSFDRNNSTTVTINITAAKIEDEGVEHDNRWEK